MTLARWDTPVIYATVETQLLRAFFEILFRPIVKVIRDANRQSFERLNGPMDALHDALRTGQVQYDTHTGEFSGQFSASISRPLETIGAKFDKRRKVYRIRPEKVPTWVIAESQTYKVTAEEAHKAITRVLAQVQISLDELAEKYAVDGSMVAKGVEAGYRAVGKELGISAELSPESMARIRREYTDNLKLRVRTFSNEQVGKLRELVEGNASAGYRFDRLISGIEARYEVSRNKAKFLARNETAFFMATHREARFAEVGITDYHWSDSRDERVRGNPSGKYPMGCGDHWHLHGKRFSYSEPPVVDPKTGRRANPGKDYNCRCVDKPILPPVRERLKKEAVAA